MTDTFTATPTAAEIIKRTAARKHYEDGGTITMLDT